VECWQIFIRLQRLRKVPAMVVILRNEPFKNTRFSSFLVQCSE
jgi:hypothetical protein